MALQTSGAISLNQIHVEVGGTSGAQASLGDSDIRVIAGESSGAIDFADCYGATSVVVTQGTRSLTQATYYGFSNASGNFGSRSPTNVNGNNLNSMSIRSFYRTNSSSGLFFTVEVDYSSSNAIDADEFTSFSFIANGTVTRLLTSEAYTSMVAGGYIRRWEWSSSNGLDSTEISNITSEWDGSGTIRTGFSL